MKKIYNQILIGAILFFLILLSGGKLFSLFNNNSVEAVGDLFVDFSNNPIFTVAHISPGQSMSKTIRIYNDADTNKLIGIKGIKKDEKKNIASQLLITILENRKELYGGKEEKNLAQFFNDSSNPNGVALTSLKPRKDTKYTIKIVFKKSAGNEYQNNMVKFDIQVGVVVVIPKKCHNLHLNNNVVYGTKGNDRLVGTEGNDLIVGFEGSDNIDGKGGNDCILAGEGIDIVNGGAGKDMCEGEIIRNCEDKIHF